MSNFDAVGIESGKRLQDAKRLLDHITQIERDVASQELVKVLKGSFFVLLYGALEKAVFYLVNQCIQILNTKHEKLLSLKPVLWIHIFSLKCKYLGKTSILYLILFQRRFNTVMENRLRTTSKQTQVTA